MATDTALPELPDGWTASAPTTDDIADLVGLLDAIQIRGKGYSSADDEQVRASAIGVGAWTRRQLVVRDTAGQVMAWPVVHDRAAGRTMIDLDIHPDAPDADGLAAALLPWIEEQARQIAILRGLDSTQLDATIYAGDGRQQGWLSEAGFAKVRTCSQMRRPVSADEATSSELHYEREGLRVRTVRVHEQGMPYAEDIQAVHQMLEDSFGDHFNSHRESFPEFVQRLREDPGHRWNHWYLAEVTDDHGDWIPAGALVSSYMGPDKEGKEGSYIDYVGTSRAARGRGAGKGLLYAVIRNAAAKGRNRVDLEVDDESPTRANEMYAALGWKPKYVTESWHKDIVADPRVDPDKMAASEKDALCEWLELYRGTVPLKIADLAGLQLCEQPCPPSSLSLLGLVRHLTDVENYWFGEIVGGVPAQGSHSCPENPDADFIGGSPDSADADIAAYYKACAASREAIAGIDDLTAALPGKRHGQSVNLRWVLIHMIEEYARHMGHADMLREAIDGRTGY